MASQEWKKRWSALNLWVRDYMLLISGAGLVFGAVLLIIGGLSLFMASWLPADWVTALGSGGRYDICTAAVGLLLVIFAGYYFIDNVYKRRKFDRLFETVSRDKFIKNRDKLEELAFELSTEHELKVQRKVKEMKIR